jgi:hypothetical protein
VFAAHGLGSQVWCDFRGTEFIRLGGPWGAGRRKLAPSVMLPTSGWRNSIDRNQ